MTTVEGVRATVEAMAPDGGFLVVVGDSSVGKTRTLYEAPWRRVARPVRVFARAAQALALRAAREVPLVDITGVVELLRDLKEAGAEAATTALTDRVVREAPIRNGPSGVWRICIR